MKEKIYFEDIICARSTPPGSSAIAVIRVSGKKSWNVLKKIFNPLKRPKNYSSHKVYYGSLINNNNENEHVDNVLIITFKEGNSFTGEESFEISCHGSEVVISLIIKILLSNGVRLAEPGEFSKRAFLNGKIDLTEAEAIMDLVNSSTQKSAQMAINQLMGRLSASINNIKENIAQVLSEVEVDIDYPEEDIDSDMSSWVEKINKTIKEFEELLSGFHRGRYYRENINAVILGKTNSGKSTLFNFLLNEDKAIVSDIHGTTRDYLDGIINVKGYGIRIYDTAGLRESVDPIEIEGTKRAIGLSLKANIIIYVISASDGISKDDIINLNKIDKDQKIIIALNKIDLIEKGTISGMDSIKADIKNDNYDIVRISALNNQGLNEFNKSIIQILTNEKVSDNIDPLITNERHADLIEKAKVNMNNALTRLKEGFLDLSSFELRESLDRLGEITGEITPQDILDRIFSDFCVGK